MPINITDQKAAATIISAKLFISFSSRTLDPLEIIIIGIKKAAAYEQVCIAPKIYSTDEYCLLVLSKRFIPASDKVPKNPGRSKIYVRKLLHTKAKAKKALVRAV